MKKGNMSYGKSKGNSGGKVVTSGDMKRTGCPKGNGGGKGGSDKRY